MKFKVEKGTKTFDELEKVFVKMKDCNKQALELIESLGFTQFGVSNNGIAGGISCIVSKTKPDGFRVVGKPYQNLYYPKKANNKELLQKFDELPIISYEEFNDTIGFKAQFSSLNYHRAFGIKKVKDVYLIDIDNKCKYTPKSDMIEILESVYLKLHKDTGGIEA